MNLSSVFSVTRVLNILPQTRRATPVLLAVPGTVRRCSDDPKSLADVTDRDASSMTPAALPLMSMTRAGTLSCGTRTPQQATVMFDVKSRPSPTPLPPGTQILGVVQRGSHHSSVGGILGLETGGSCVADRWAVRHVFLFVYVLDLVGLFAWLWLSGVLFRCRTLRPLLRTSGAVSLSLAAVMLEIYSYVSLLVYGPLYIYIYCHILPMFVERGSAMVCSGGR